MPSIDGIGSHNADSWQDPEFVMDNGLKAVDASQKLSQNFNEFLKHSLDALKKEAFLLIFDDIDVDASKGWVVLETIRKYFTGSRLITLISGDLELYTTVVRQKKWQNFGKEILKYEGIHTDNESGLNEFRRLVTTLTAQYMLKIMQPKYRIYLNTLLHRKITKGKLGINIAFDDRDRGEDLELMYKKILGSYGVINKVEFEAFATFLLNQPLRSQIQFLHLFASNAMVDNNALSDIFLSNLLEQKIDISIAANSPKYLTSVILNLLLDKHNLEDLYQLQPTTTDESLNASLYSLSLLLSNTIKNNYRFVIFDFLIKIGYLRNLMTVLPYKNISSSDDKLRPSIEDLCSRAGVSHDGVLRDVTGKIQAYLYGALELEGTVNYITPFFTQLKALRSISRQNHTDRIDFVLGQETVNNASRILGYIPSFLGTFGHKNESRVGYSFYLLLAAIGEIVKEYETVLRDESENEVVLLKQLLKELSQLRSYPIIGFAKKQTETIIRELNDLDGLRHQDTFNDRSDDDLVYAILQWLKSNNTIITASHLLGKITTRFYYAMSNIAEASTQSTTLDELFHRQIIAFMNAILVEDIRENLGGQSLRLNINNTNTDDGILINNLRSVMGPARLHRSLGLSFSKWMLACPLLLAYIRIDGDSDLQHLLYRYSETNSIEFERVPNINYLLNQIAIRSQGENDSETPDIISLASPQLLRNPIALVRLLQRNNIPFEWFVEGENRGETKRRNNLIRRDLASIFLDDNRTSGRIRTFRNYLANNNIRW